MAAVFFGSPRGKGIYLSILLRPKSPIKIEDLPVLATVATCSALRRIGVEARVTGKDDIVCEGKKLAGILTEALVECESKEIRFAVLGIGINVYAPPGDPLCDEQILTSLFSIIGRYQNRSELIAMLLEELYHANVYLETVQGRKELYTQYNLMKTKE